MFSQLNMSVCILRKQRKYVRIWCEVIRTHYFCFQNLFGTQIFWLNWMKTFLWQKTFLFLRVFSPLKSWHSLHPDNICSALLFTWATGTVSDYWNKTFTRTRQINQSKTQHNTTRDYSWTHQSTRTCRRKVLLQFNVIPSYVLLANNLMNIESVLLRYSAW